MSRPVRVGDPDPTPYAATVRGDRRVCQAAEPVWGFLCTRPIGHVGSHIAGTGDEVAAVWGVPDEPVPRRRRGFLPALYGAIALAYVVVAAGYAAEGEPLKATAYGALVLAWAGLAVFWARWDR